MKQKQSVIKAVIVFVVWVGSLTWGVWAAHLAQGKEAGAPVAHIETADTGASGLPTPQLIEAALARGEIDKGTADLYLAYALADYDQLLAPYRSNAPWHGTLPLLRLRESVQRMAAGPTRAAIESLLTGSCSSSGGSLPNVLNTTHYHIEYNTISGGLTINQYADSLETTWNTEVTAFGWAAPPVLTSNPPPGNRYHVRIDNLGGGLYGFVSSSGVHAGFVGNNPNTPWDEGDALASCMVLNRDYSGFPGSPQRALDATTAHEFNHSIQFGYGALIGSNAADSIFIEGGATWMEDEVFDNANDNYNYLWPTFEMCMGEYTASPYPYWITFRGLTERYGTGTGGGGERVMQDFWEATSSNTGSNLVALNTALVNAGANLADAYHAYAVAVKFNKNCGGGYSYPYCFEEGANYVSAAGATVVHGAINSIGGNYNDNLADNYALNWITLPASGGPYNVTLANNAAGGQLRGSVVCDTGATLNVTPLPAVVGAGNSSTLSGFNPAGCTSVVAVITNQAQTADNPSSCTLRSYRLSVGSGSPPPPDLFLYLPAILKPSAPAPPPPPPASLVNGDFESGVAGWAEFSAQGWPLILLASEVPMAAHSGSWIAWLGGDHNETAYIQQQVTVPAGAPYLRYWHWIDSEDVCGYDFGRVIINGSTVVDEYALCGSTDTGGWVEHAVNLNAYAGQNVSLRIQAETDESLLSNLFVDDVSFQASLLGASGAPPAHDLPGHIGGKTEGVVGR